MGGERVKWVYLLRHTTRAGFPRLLQVKKVSSLAGRILPHFSRYNLRRKEIVLDLSIHKASLNFNTRQAEPIDPLSVSESRRIRFV